MHPRIVSVQVSKRVHLPDNVVTPPSDSGDEGGSSIQPVYPVALAALRGYLLLYGQNR